MAPDCDGNIHSDTLRFSLSNTVETRQRRIGFRRHPYDASCGSQGAVDFAVDEDENHLAERIVASSDVERVLPVVLSVRCIA